jgi:hypothetical protein
VKSCQNPSVAPFGGLAAADFVAAPIRRSLESDVASFVPKLIWKAFSSKHLKYLSYLENNRLV